MKNKEAIVSLTLSLMLWAPVSFSQVCKDLGRERGAPELRSLDPKNYGLKLLKDGSIPVVIHLMSQETQSRVHERDVQEAFKEIDPRFPQEFNFTIESIKTYSEDEVNIRDIQDVQVKANPEKQKLNIYFVDEIKDACGMASYPEAIDQGVVISSICLRNEAYLAGVLTHEIGHFFGLPHTHQGWGTPDQESVNRCEITGDLFCDTPPDPNLFNFRKYISLSFKNNGSDPYCAWSVSTTRFSEFFDSNSNQYFIPNVENAMAYSRSECLVQFSTEQKKTLIKNLLFRSGQKNHLSAPQDEAEVNIYPNPAKAGEPIHVRVNVEKIQGYGGMSAISMGIWTMDGRALQENIRGYITPTPGVFLFSIVLPKKGIYVGYIVYGDLRIRKPVVIIVQ